MSNAFCSITLRSDDCIFVLLLLGLCSSDSQLRSTGNVWERCDVFKTLPRNNQDAVLVGMRATGGLVKDALEEIEEVRIKLYFI